MRAGDFLRMSGEHDGHEFTLRLNPSAILMVSDDPYPSLTSRAQFAA